MLRCEWAKPASLEAPAPRPPALRGRFAAPQGEGLKIKLPHAEVRVGTPASLEAPVPQGEDERAVRTLPSKLNTKSPF